MSNLSNSKESHLRSVLKGISWRILATIITITIVFIITGEIDTALEIGAIEVIAKIVIYYVHERVWLLIPHGITRKDNNQQ